MDVISLKTISKESKIALLEELGYKSDGEYIYDPDGNKLKDKYTREIVDFNNMLILPGSSIILDNNPLSIASYIEDYGEIFE